ncbi:MAG: transglycosylase domain-containing protein [archaeon]|nr:transglycosylase domain-containing protein [archaeon]
MKKIKKKETKKEEIELIDESPKETKKKEVPVRDKKRDRITLLIDLVLLIITFLITYVLKKQILLSVGFTGLLFVALFFAYFLDKPKKEKSKGRKIIKVLLILILIGCIIGILGVGAFFYYVVKNAPDFETELLKEKESTILYDANGNEYAKLGQQIRTNIDYDQISETFIDALIATEDSRFFQHNGFDLARFVKASFYQVYYKLIHSSANAGGGSTLTMQLAKNTFTDATQDSGFEGIVRKFTDIYISIFQLEKKYTKEQIIEMYVNNKDLVGVVAGIEEVSLYYFNKSAKDLNIAESAMLAGLYQSPVSYNPLKNPNNAEKRRETVLNLMVRHGYITKQEKDLALSVPITSLVTGTTATSEYQGYINLVCDEVQERYGVDPYATPMFIYTNMNKTKQRGLNDVLNGKTWSWKDDVIETGIAVLNSQNGKIEAIGSGRKVVAKGMSFASDLNRQIGSTAKPLFDYGPGIEYNNWSTYQIFVDEPYTYSSGKPMTNYDSGYRGTLTLRDALRDSRNVCALKAFQSVDNRKIVQLVTSVGLTPEIDGGYIHEAHSIGAFTGSSPLQIAGAYQIFSNGGYYYKPYAVSKVVFRSNNEEYEYSSPKIKVISEATSFMIADVLKNYVWLNLPSDTVAEKTGTTNLDKEFKIKNNFPNNMIRDYWITGFTPETVVSIWYGYEYLNVEHYLRVDIDDFRKNLLRVVCQAVLNHNNKQFVMPSTVRYATVEFGTDPPKLPSEYTPADKKVTELFKAGTEPTVVSKAYYPLPTVTGLEVKSVTGGTKISWTAATDPKYYDDEKDKEKTYTLVYNVYKDDKLLTTTQSNTYLATDLASVFGTYKVYTCYQEVTTNNSQPAIYEVTQNYYATLNQKATKEYKTGSTALTNIVNTLMSTDNVRVTLDGENVSEQATITLSIKDKDGNVVTSIDKTKPNEYTFTYSVKIENYKTTLTTTLKIVYDTQSTNSVTN